MLNIRKDEEEKMYLGIIAALFGTICLCVGASLFLFGPAVGGKRQTVRHEQGKAQSFKRLK